MTTIPGYASVLRKARTNLDDQKPGRQTHEVSSAPILLLMADDCECLGLHMQAADSEPSGIIVHLLSAFSAISKNCDMRCGDGGRSAFVSWTHSFVWA